MKTIQYFTPEYLQKCKSLTPDQILQFLEDYKMLVGKVPEKCKPTNLKSKPSDSKTVSKIL